MRHNYLLVLACVAIVIGFSSCLREQHPTQPSTESSIVISNGQLTFQPDGGSSRLTATANGEIKVVSRQAWCHAQLDKDGIQIDVDPYDGIQSRFSRVDIICGDDTQYITVHQYGVIIQAFNVSDISLLNKENPYSKVYEYNANVTMVASSDSDWITVASDDKKLELTIAPNSEGTFRSGTVNVKVGYQEKTITVTQFDPDVTSKLTDYTLTCKDGTTDVSFDVTLEQSSDYSFRLKMANTKYAMDLSFEDVILVGEYLEIPLGANVGTGHKTGTRNYYVFPILTNSDVATRVTSYANAVTEGNYVFKFSKVAVDEQDPQAGEKWTAVPDNPDYEGYFFHLEMWTAETHAGNSMQRLILKDMVLTEK